VACAIDELGASMDADIAHGVQLAFPVARDQDFAVPDPSDRIGARLVHLRFVNGELPRFGENFLLFNLEDLWRVVKAWRKTIPADDRSIS
jgi:hypothetical protein